MINALSITRDLNKLDEGGELYTTKTARESNMKQLQVKNEILIALIESVSVCCSFA
jgi:hypothetical protein